MIIWLDLRPINVLSFFSVIADTMGIAALLYCRSEQRGDMAVTSLTFSIATLNLAVIKRWALNLPIPFARPWDWALALRSAKRTTATMETTYGL